MPITARSNLRPHLPDRKMMGVMTGPMTTLTPTRMKSRSLPPAASNSGPGYQRDSISASTAAAIAMLKNRCRPDARQRVISFLSIRGKIYRHERRDRNAQLDPRAAEGEHEAHRGPRCRAGSNRRDAGARGGSGLPARRHGRQRLRAQSARARRIRAVVGPLQRQRPRRRRAGRVPCRARPGAVWILWRPDGYERPRQYAGAAAEPGRVRPHRIRLARYAAWRRRVRLGFGLDRLPYGRGCYDIRPDAPV